MEIKKAFEILEIDIDSYNVTAEILKKQYHIKSLQHHPDKNGNTIESTIKFREINEAYLLLRPVFTVEQRQSDVDADVDVDVDVEKELDYTDLLNSFITEFSNKKYINVLKEIITNCSYKMFEKMSKSYSMDIYNFLSKNKYILHITQEILTRVLEIIHNKEIQNIIINPSIDDLFENNIYKLNYKNSLYLVPLWHHEVYFDDEDSCVVDDDVSNFNADSNDVDGKICKEFVVTCFPVLPNNIIIDEDNNFIVYLDIVFEIDLLYKQNIYFYLGKKEFCIPINELQMKQTQVYVLKKQGISKIKDEIDNVEEKSDIIVTITFV
jgi:hypothetical protein